MNGARHAHAEFGAFLPVPDATNKTTLTLALKHCPAGAGLGLLSTAEATGVACLLTDILVAAQNGGVHEAVTLYVAHLQEREERESKAREAARATRNAVREATLASLEATRSRIAAAAALVPQQVEPDGGGIEQSVAPEADADAAVALAAANAAAATAAALVDAFNAMVEGSIRSFMRMKWVEALAAPPSVVHPERETAAEAAAKMHVDVAGWLRDPRLSADIKVLALRLASQLHGALGDAPPVRDAFAGGGFVAEAAAKLGTMCRAPKGAKRKLPGGVDPLCTVAGAFGCAHVHRSQTAGPGQRGRCKRHCTVADCTVHRRVIDAAAGAPTHTVASLGTAAPSGELRPLLRRSIPLLAAGVCAVACAAAASLFDPLIANAASAAAAAAAAVAEVRFAHLVADKFDAPAEPAAPVTSESAPFDGNGISDDSDSELGTARAARCAHAADRPARRAARAAAAAAAAAPPFADAAAAPVAAVAPAAAPVHDVSGSDDDDERLPPQFCNAAAAWHATSPFIRDLLFDAILAGRDTVHTVHSFNLWENNYDGQPEDAETAYAAYVAAWNATRREYVTSNLGLYAQSIRTEVFWRCLLPSLARGSAGELTCLHAAGRSALAVLDLSWTDFEEWERARVSVT